MEKEQLIKISEHNGQRAVSAFDLYKRLGYNITNFGRWKQKNITENRYANGMTDWFELPQNGEQNKINSSEMESKADDVLLSLDFAKRLAIIARTDEGENIRKYFIAVENETLQKSNTALIYKMHEIDKKIATQKAIKRNATEQLKNLAELLIDTKAEIYKQLPKPTNPQTALPHQQTEIEFTDISDDISDDVSDNVSDNVSDDVDNSDTDNDTDNDTTDI